MVAADNVDPIYPKFELPWESVLGSWIVWTLCSYGLIWLGAKLLTKPKRLDERAFSVRDGQNIDISGYGNVVNAINTVDHHHIRERDEKSSWSTRLTGGLIGVLISILNKFLQ